MGQAFLETALRFVENGRVPDALVRHGIRRLLKDRLRQTMRGGWESQGERTQALREATRTGPVAVLTDKANEQHYEVPTAFYQHVLGHRLKYSCCHWPTGTKTLNDAEDAALAATVSRADLHDGQNVLELGCGWGSLTLWMAERFPRSSITAVSRGAPPCSRCSTSNHITTSGL